jgi:hypothetical protein
VTQPDIWIGAIEISWIDENRPGVFRPAFTVVTTWATNAEEFREKCIRMLESYGWKLIDVDRANPVPDNVEFNEKWRTCSKEREVIQTQSSTGRFIHIRDVKRTLYRCCEQGLSLAISFRD